MKHISIFLINVIVNFVKRTYISLVIAERKDCINLKLRSNNVL